MLTCILSSQGEVGYITEERTGACGSSTLNPGGEQVAFLVSRDAKQYTPQGPPDTAPVTPDNTPDEYPGGGGGGDCEELDFDKYLTASMWNSTMPNVCESDYHYQEPTGVISSGPPDPSPGVINSMTIGAVALMILVGVGI